jgi:hypothetical protein
MSAGHQGRDRGSARGRQYPPVHPKHEVEDRLRVAAGDGDGDRRDQHEDADQPAFDVRVVPVSQAKPESFLVTKQDRLEPQEQNRARDWGTKLATAGD